MLFSTESEKGILFVVEIFWKPRWRKRRGRFGPSAMHADALEWEIDNAGNTIYRPLVDWSKRRALSGWRGPRSAHAHGTHAGHVPVLLMVLYTREWA